jgi:NAD(P)-dependent dehydrogenase (short-subunit alcohol dehydrogenase family)
MVPADYDFNFSSPKSLTAPGFPHPKRWPFSPFLLRYGIAKAANSLFAVELQRRLDTEKSTIMSMSIHPGGVATKGAEGVFWSFFVPIMRLTFLPPDKGAITSVFAATASEPREREKEYKGQYLIPYGKVGTPHRAVKDEKVARDLWETTKTEVNRYLAANNLAPLSI